MDPAKAQVSAGEHPRAIGKKGVVLFAMRQRGSRRSEDDRSHPPIALARASPWTYLCVISIAARACARVVHSLPRLARAPIGMAAQTLQLAQHNSQHVSLNTSPYHHSSRQVF